MFVHPNIVQTVADNEDNNPSKKEIAIDEILLSDANQLVFGIKESGKTILLDKLSIELIKNNTKYKKVPVYIDYPTVRNRRFETILSSFLNIKIHSVGEFLNNHRVVLLIDNISFNDIDISNLDRLSQFVSKYPYIQIIATALQYIEGSIPVRHLPFDFYKTFETLQILGFKTKQIKELIVLWFSNSERSVSQKYFRGIIDFFVSLNLPRTPLAVSMYLWIIEHQENYRPINHAVMLENFIERILEKLSKKEVFTDEFGYTNKLHLLAEIAYKMLILNDSNYRIEYHDLFNFIHEQIKSRRFDYLAENVLNHFLNVGILVKEIEDSVTYIRFRFSCFFQFFLMKFMEYDEDFHNHVLDEGNFLDFIDEIDYFTGLKRDCSDILSTLVNRMMLEFQDIVEEIERLPIKYDEFFREDESIIKSLPDDFINKLPDKKPTQRQIDSITDSMLDNIKPEKEIQKKGSDLDTFERWEKLMSVASKVLKNTEETKVQDLKDSSYAKILRCSLAYSSIFKYFLEQRIKNADDSSKMHNSITSQRYIIPLINEMALFSLMGTKKLSAVIRDKIKADLKTSNITDFEKFMSVFLYADIRANDYELYLREYVKSIKHPYIYDMCLLKIVAYYYLRSNNKESDKLYLNMIADLVIKAKGSRQTIKGKTFEKYKDKSKIIQEYSKRKIDHRKQKVYDE